MSQLKLVLLCMFVSVAYTKMNEARRSARIIARCFDVNDDGFVSRCEMDMLLTNVSSFKNLLDDAGGRQRFEDRYILKYDSNEDGLVSDMELEKTGIIYTKSLKESLKGRKITALSSNRPKSRKEAKRMFKMYDLNGDGKVYRQEVEEFFDKRPSYRPLLEAAGGIDHFINGWFSEMDLDENGNVSKDEFLRVAKVFMHLLKTCRWKVAV